MVAIIPKQRMVPEREVASRGTSILKVIDCYDRLARKSLESAHALSISPNSIQLILDGPRIA